MSRNMYPECETQRRLVEEVTFNMSSPSHDHASRYARLWLHTCNYKTTRTKKKNVLIHAEARTPIVFV